MDIDYSTTDSSLSDSDVSSDSGHIVSSSLQRNRELNSGYDFSQHTSSSASFRDEEMFDDNRMGGGSSRDKGNRGLRHFAMKVMEKVRNKNVTTYNEVADELVMDSIDPLRSDSPTHIKNIRRRVYDSLNVLMAMHIIIKHKKQIKWNGLPLNNATELKQLQSEKNRVLKRIREKRRQIREQMVQLVSLNSLIDKNRERIDYNGAWPSKRSIISLPFIALTTDVKTNTDICISPMKSNYQFTFNRPFAVNDDTQVLQLLGFSYGLNSDGYSLSLQNDEKQESEEKQRGIDYAMKCVPESLRDTVQLIANNRFERVDNIPMKNYFVKQLSFHLQSQKLPPVGSKQPSNEESSLNQSYIPPQEPQYHKPTQYHHHMEQGQLVIPQLPANMRGPQPPPSMMHNYEYSPNISRQSMVHHRGNTSSSGGGMAQPPSVLSHQNVYDNYSDEN
ncbi:hypothetical protein SNEBB_009135 [Seison nebaliae]|nr:hypothetical protein SNEBB_009135 [Seison nebaliae]